MNSFDTLLSIHFLVKYHNIYNFTLGNDTTSGIKSLICTVFSMFNIILAHINLLFSGYNVLETKLVFTSFDKKNLLR